MAPFGEEKRKELSEKRREPARAKKRVKEIDSLIQKISVGIVREPMPEEMEELFQEHMRNRTSSQSSKTA